MSTISGFSIAGGLLLVALLLFNGIITFQPGSGAATAETSDQVQSRIDKMKALVSGKANLPKDESVGTGKAAADPALPEGPPAFVKDKVTYTKYLEALQAYFDYRKSGLMHRRDVFEWQLLSTKIIFVIVLLLVSAGVYFAAVQFHVEIRDRKAGKAAPQSKTEITASAEGIKVSSGVLGVIILSLSLAFFYLYLVYVYPIGNVF